MKHYWSPFDSPPSWLVTHRPGQQLPNSPLERGWGCVKYPLPAGRPLNDLRFLLWRASGIEAAPHSEVRARSIADSPVVLCGQSRIVPDAKKIHFKYILI